MHISRRHVLTLFQYGLCLAAIFYLVHKVPWQTQVRLHDANGPRVPLIAEYGDRLLVERGGRREILSASEAYHVTMEGRQVPQIEVGMREVVLRLNRKWALYSFLLFAPVVVVQAYRLVLMVAVQGVALSLWNAIKLNLAGNFFNFALPGTTGGDVIKAYYLTRYTHLKTEVVTTVFLDRVIGLLGLVLLAVGAMLFTHELRLSADRLALWGVLLFSAALATAAVFSNRFRQRLGLAAWVERLPAGRQLLRIGRATIALRRHKTRVLWAFLLTVLLQGTCSVSGAIMAWALGMRGPGGTLGQIVYFAGYLSVGFLVASIPLTPQAIGVMEAAYIQFFTPSGLNTASQAVALAFAVRLIQLGWAIPGVLVPLLGAHLPSREELARAGLDGESCAGERGSEKSRR